MAIHVSVGAIGLINLWKKKTQLAKEHAFEAGFDIQLATMVGLYIYTFEFVAARTK